MQGARSAATETYQADRRGSEQRATRQRGPQQFFNSLLTDPVHTGTKKKAVHARGSADRAFSSCWRPGCGLLSIPIDGILVKDGADSSSCTCPGIRLLQPPCSCSIPPFPWQVVSFVLNSSDLVFRSCRGIWQALCHILQPYESKEKTPVFAGTRQTVDAGDVRNPDSPVS